MASVRDLVSAKLEAALCHSITVYHYASFPATLNTVAFQAKNIVRKATIFVNSWGARFDN